MSISAGDTLSRYLNRVFRPFVRFALRHGLRLPDIVDALRTIFVEVAREELLRMGQKPSVSRIAVTTGMNRRDVQRASLGEPYRDITLSVPTRVVGLWRTTPRLTSKNGKPRVLSISGADSEFSALVKEVTQDIHPASVLFELERVGAVLRTAKGLQLVSQGYLSTDPEQGMRMLSEDLDQLILAVDENLFANKPEKNLHVRTVSSYVSSKDLPAIQDWILREGGAFHRKVRDYLAEFDLQLKPCAEKEADAQVVITSFGRASTTKNS